MSKHSDPSARLGTSWASRCKVPAGTPCLKRMTCEYEWRDTVTTRDVWFRTVQYENELGEWIFFLLPWILKVHKSRVEVQALLMR